MMHITSTGSAYLENVGLQTIRQVSLLAASDKHTDSG